MVGGGGRVLAATLSMSAIIRHKIAMTGPGLVCVWGAATQIEKLVNLNFKDVKSFLFRRAIQNAKQNLERERAGTRT